MATIIIGSPSVSDISVAKAASTLVNAATVFTIAGGPIQIMELMAVCITANDGTASTLQWSSSPTVGSPTTISGATTTLASIAAGASIILTPTALSTAPVIALAAAGGVQLGLAAQNHIIVLPGTITLVIGTGSTTGTWQHFMRYRPMGVGVNVS